MRHPALLKTSGWTYSTWYQELEAAHEWGCPDPDYYYKLSQNARLDILAWYVGKKKMEAVNAYEANEESKRNAKKQAHLSRGRGRRR